MFETQKVRRHDKFGKDSSQHKNKCKSKMGQDQVSGGVSVTLLASRIRCNFLWKPPSFVPNKVKIGNKVQFSNKFANWCNA